MLISEGKNESGGSCYNQNLINFISHAGGVDSFKQLRGMNLLRDILSKYLAEKKPSLLSLNHLPWFESSRLSFFDIEIFYTHEKFIFEPFLIN